MGFETTRCVVYNSTHEPIGIIPAKDALLLVMSGKAITIEEHPTMVIRSPKQQFSVPTTIALKKYVRGRNVYRTPAILNQRNLFIRDGHTCQYCMRSKNELRSAEFLTRDHIVPESIGGKSTWENLVTACSTCNNKKADTRLDKTDLVLNKKPITPTLFQIWMKTNTFKMPK